MGNLGVVRCSCTIYTGLCGTLASPSFTTGHHTPITMKVAIVLCVCLAVAMAQFNQHGQHHGGHAPLAALVHNEVVELVKANAGLTSAECTSKCDALFGLLESHDEQSTDDHCKHACECDIDHVGCPNNMHSGAPMHPTQSA